ncbi:TonB-dependent receptor [Compostibacter hankyongensis]|uniref:TonB-dependent receptor n=1 Tax=Compostibacter hankyongensis TaxID=1007089 RepID=A0ABP8FJJ2_9BACT
MLAMKLTVVLLLTTCIETNAGGYARPPVRLPPPPVNIRGAVSDSATEKPLSGVTIQVKGAATGTTTDATGKFELSVPDNAVLLVSFLGYNKKEIPVNGRTHLTIYLSPSATGLDQLVVVGYSTKRQSELSSSVAVVNEKQLRGITTPDIGTMLQGKVPGLVVSNSRGRPGNNTDIVIRGVGSIGAGHAPLYVVDGMIGGSVDPNNIASVTILKDAAATGLYGSRAANGVIVITTKSGQSGKTRISYNGSFGLTRRQRGNIRMMNSAELYAMQGEGYRNYYDEQVAAGDPAFTGTEFDDYLESVLPSALMNTRTDWQSLLSRTGYVNSHQLAVSGGNEKTTFYVSGNYYRELGTMLSTDYQRMDLRVNLKHRISDQFTLYTRISAGGDKSPNDPLTGQEGEMSQFYNNMPWDSAFEADGVTPYNPLKAGSHWIGNAKSNYFYNIRHQNDITRNGHLNADLQLDIKLADWISFSTKNRIGFSGYDHTQLLDKYHQLASTVNGQITQDYSYHSAFLTSNLLNLEHSFGNHNLSGILGEEYSYSRNSNTLAVGKDIPVGLSALNAAGSPKSISGNKTETGFLSYFAEADYNYLHRYFLVGSARRDASSLFGANNRWASFYSIGASWIASNEQFLSRQTWIDLLKLRFSYGTTGNANISPYLSLGTYAFSQNSTYDAISGAWPARVPNPDLTWEKGYTTNIGLEFAILKRFNLEVDLYNRTNKDLLQNVPLSAASGFSGQQRNVGSVRNRGIDVSFTSTNLNGKLRWETMLNVNVNRNKVLALNGHEDIASGNMRIREGLPLRYFYMKQWAGVDPQTGNPLWVRWEDKDGNIINGADKKDPVEVSTTGNYNEASNLFIRSAYPDFTGGIRNDLYYGNFSLSVLCNFVAGQSIYFSARERRDADGNSLNQNQMKLQKGWVRWEKPGDIATHPKLLAGGTASNSTSSRYLEDAGYFRIQNIRLGYSIPHVYRFSDFNVYLSIDNLAVFTPFSGDDPDVDMESPVISQNSDNSTYTTNQKIMIGLNITL